MRAVAGRVHVAVGVDRSPAMIGHARSLGRARYALARAEHLPFAGHAFTAVLC